MNRDETAAAVERVVALFEALQPADVLRLGDFYMDDARFKDPFNDVAGLPAVQRVFAHMFETLHAPRFDVTECILDAGQCFLVWDFSFRFRSFRPRQTFVVRGGSQLRFAADGRITLHRDWWDAAEEVYEKLPVLGALMRLLKRRAAS
ncbi:nuclear transport factor 2 family protein [Caenimonas sedimenti]|uniref:Nuclear transport factor 2 family protein n=1 Tax=Caenimonas sedimenti TaxID=2596921 RepID=A0A562ZFZ6_9BURK|nr:nuclear transport factor 2 family protein [Caenimonas sedimenti]TWO66632.1 nuclear transport factor 2 family protein [Caenimonas sedimenti]